MYKNSISKSKCSAKTLFGDIKSEFIKMLQYLYRSKVDRFSQCYLHVNFQCREHFLKYNSHIYYNIKSILVR